MDRHHSDTKGHDMHIPEPHGNFELQPLKFPYHEYKANRLQPCATTTSGHVLPVHLLACGHLVAVDDLEGPSDNRCGLNCLHVDMWMGEQTAILSKDRPVFHTDVDTDMSLGQTIASGTPAEYPVMPKETKFQAQNSIYCEICHGIPASSFFAGNRETLLKRAIALTRFAIEYHTGYSQQQILDRLCIPFYNSSPLGYDWKLTHTLICGHEVWAQPARPCASNCSSSPECKCRIFPGNKKQTDVIFCHECTYRAELVYERYAKAQKRVPLSTWEQPVSDLLVPHAEWNDSRPLEAPAAGYAYKTSSESEDHPPSSSADDLPTNVALDGYNVSTPWDTIS